MAFRLIFYRIIIELKTKTKYKFDNTQDHSAGKMLTKIGKKTINSLIMNYRLRSQMVIHAFCTNNQNDKKNSTLSEYQSSKILKQQELQEEEDLQEKINQQMVARIQQLQKLHQKTQDLIDLKLKFPIKICGTKDRYESRFGYLPERIFSYYKIPKARVNQYLLKMFKASLYAIADRNQQYMEQYWEQGLKKATLKAIDKSREDGFSIKVEKDQNFLQNISESCEIIDGIMFRGLSMDRNQNQKPDDYIKFSEPDQFGLITYTPKHITENNQNFIDPKKNKTAYDGYQRMLLRVLVRIKSPLRLNIPEFNVPEEVYTWEHLCVMQNQMVAPKHLQSSYKLETLIQWMGKYRFGPWKITDIDNFMKGNSPFINHRQEDQEELDPIFKGTKLDRSSHIDIRMI